MKKIFWLVAMLVLAGCAVYAQDRMSANVELPEMCSRAERMKYEAVPKPNVRDTLFSNYFTEHHYGVRMRSSAGEWTIPQNGTNNDVILLAGNEYPDVWRDPAGTPFRIAVALQIAKDNTVDTDNIIEVYVIHTHACNNRGMCDRDTATYGVPWNAFRAPDKDTVFFSGQFRFTDDLRPVEDSLLLEVHSRRQVTMRLRWIAVEDSLAHDLCAGDLMLDGLSDDPFSIWRAQNVKHNIIKALYAQGLRAAEKYPLAKSVSALAERRLRSEWAAYGRIASLANGLQNDPPLFLKETQEDNIKNVFPSAIIIDKNPLQ